MSEMFFFGQQLAGQTHVGRGDHEEEEETREESPQVMTTATTTTTPQTEMIHQLTDQEHRLLEELDRTRNRLEREWEAKQQQQQYDTSNVKVLRTHYDILPILTTSGQTPFEMGITSSDSPTGVAKIHSLPVFHLPQISPATKASLNKSRTHVSGQPQFSKDKAGGVVINDAQDVEMMEEDWKKFGLSEQDLVEMGLMASSSTSSFSPPPPVNVAVPSSLTHQLKKKKKGLAHPDRRIVMKKVGRSNSGSKIKSKRTTTKAKRTQQLQKQLMLSIGNVQAYTKLVQHDLSEVQKLCPVTNIRAHGFMKKWGRSKLKRIFAQMKYTLERRAMTKWKETVASERMMDKRNAFSQYRASKKVVSLVENWAQRRLILAWETWSSHTADLIYREEHQIEYQAAIQIQVAWRGYRSREFAKLIKAEQVAHVRHAAAVKIQTCVRGRASRTLARELSRELRRQRAAITIQTFVRGVASRNFVMELRRLELELESVTKIQRHTRRWLGRRHRRAREELRVLHEAARVLQRLVRGRAGRRLVATQRQLRVNTRGATVLQSWIRGIQARVKVEARRQVYLQWCEKTRVAATDIQRVYRGHRARLATDAQMTDIWTRRALREAAAVSIQGLVRRHLALKSVKILQAVRTTERVTKARAWAECWDEEHERVFYYHAASGEALWEPPEDGYTKMTDNESDGETPATLVLCDGRVILDVPEAEAKSGAEEMALANDESKVGLEGDILCIECEDVEASRHCEQCEDNYCDECFNATHGSGKRHTHTWVSMGPIKCCECEKTKASRWCGACDDPYCLGCFQIIHAKGKKAAHEFTKIGFSRENDATYDAFLQTEDYAYISHAEVDTATYEEEASLNHNSSSYEDTQEYEAEETYVYDEVQGQEEEEGVAWETHVDEESGATYYYNPMTGETQWA